ncbi:MAG TPA: GntR family transcriptional regulator [Acidimicrobiales bacterium]|nr:GntR family transcriptional regulator [Acidimicrobiales bacterium]
MAKERRGRSLVEDVYESLRADILFGRRLPSSRLQVNEIAEAYGVSLSVVREAVTRLASEDLVESAPQRGFRVRPISVDHLQDLTWVRVQLETLALRESIAKGDVAWESALVAAHHRLSATPMYLADGSGNQEWMSAHGAFHAALAAGAGSPILERLRRQLYDASELYRYWVGNLPHHPTGRDVAEEHRAVCDAAMARDADLAVELLTRHLETTARDLEAVAPQLAADVAQTA